MTPKYAGQIIRINLENFMSYDNVEIYPGSNLNLIIGPNGTGKSSIVCAVLLCLGGKLKTLGRADELSSFVKSGCTQSCVEIELCDLNQGNVIIKRKILTNNKSEFMVNGKVSTAAKVNEIKRRYNIQIDNLCSFLPQDKVQDFSKLNPQQLLDQTQRTVGSGALVQMLEELKELKLKAESQKKSCEALESELEKEVQKNERLTEQVKRFRERVQLSDKLKVLNQKLAWVKYQLEVDNKRDIDRDTKLAEEIYKEKKKAVEKYEQDLREFDSQLNNYQKLFTAAKKNEAGKEEAMHQQLGRTEQKIDALENLKIHLQAKLKEESEKKQELLRCKQNVDKLTNDLNFLKETIGSETNFELQLKEVENEFKKYLKEMNDLNQTKFNLEQNEDTLRQEFKHVASECENLKERQNFRLEYIKQREPDVYKSMQWLKENKHLFQSRIYNPMLLELNVPDPKMAKFVESRIAYKDLISFCCTNPDDLNLLVEKLRGEYKWKINVVCSDEYSQSQPYVSEIPISDLRPYGFHSYMKDHITGPEDIIRFLCKMYRIHNIPIGDDRVKANCKKVPQKIFMFYSSSQVFTVKYSVYSGDKIINARKLRKARFFSTPSDTQRIQDLVKRGRELEFKLKNVKLEISTVDTEMHNLRTQLEKVKEKKKNLARTVQERQLIQENLSRALRDCKRAKEALRDPQELEKETTEKEKNLKREILKNLADLKRISEEHEKKKSQRLRCELKHKLFKFGKEHILENKSRCTEEVSAKEALFREMRERQRGAEYKCEQLKRKAKQLTDNVSIEDRRHFQKFTEAFSKLPESPEELEGEIEAIQMKTEFLQGGHVQVLQEYEKREENIAELTAMLESKKKNLEERRNEMAVKRNEWLIPLRDLISNINSNFEKYFEAMGCAGEVTLVTGESEDDFEKYGIKIKVKFRDGIPLQELSRHFQSGGERAVSTAIYMLSMQELTSVPFRFVDEINQGMDPVNERRILQLIMHVTEKNLSSQYFLITPKLLPNVECSNSMTVHCIYNGPHAIPASEWKMNQFLGIESGDEESENSR